MKDVRARGYILSTTELYQQRLLISCTTAHQMWRTLSAQHLEHAADNRLDVQARFYSYQYQPGTDMKNHIAEITSAQHLEHAADNRLDVQARFYSYQYQPGTDMKNHIAEITSIAHHLGEICLPVNEEQLCTKIISILPAEYHGFKTAWHNSNQERQTILSLTAKLLQEEREQARWKTKTTDNEVALQAQSSTSFTRNGRRQEEPHTHPSAGSSAKGSYREGRNKHCNPSRPRNHHGSQRKDLQECTYCVLDNHLVDRCNTKRRHERTDKERADLAKRMKKDHDKMATDLMRDVTPNQDFSLVSTSPRYHTRSNGDWFADSGATQHMSDQKDWLHDFGPYPTAPGPSKESDQPAIL
ncbi:uncharacterized protein LOC116927507 [Daphnia magna]|uniref:uncharacterized protein LOC116927507 n=1 Tax=Daphnia magna TaxID=35525 RepID=UPI001E1BB77F|nr:uncharacterized protein LOC116927507 [Daphnia magna]